MTNEDALFHFLARHPNFSAEFRFIKAEREKDGDLNYCMFDRWTVTLRKDNRGVVSSATTWKGRDEAIKSALKGVDWTPPCICQPTDVLDPECLHHTWDAVEENDE
jgi:hypothetical protein